KCCVRIAHGRACFMTHRRPRLSAYRSADSRGASMFEPQELERRIKSALPDAQIAIRDLTGGGDHYQVEVVSQAFAGVTPVMRHRMVYAPLKDVLGGALHALSLTTRTPDEGATR